MAILKGYEGKLPPGAAEQLARSLDSWRQSKAMGLNVRVGICSGPGCQLAEALDGQSWALDDVPSLPIPGCIRSPCCGCCYTPVQPDLDLTPMTAEEAAENEREFEELVTQLPSKEEEAVRGILANALKAFGIK